MKKQFYEKMINGVRRTPGIVPLVVGTDHILTKISYIAYPVFLLFLFMQRVTGAGNGIFEGLSSGMFRGMEPETFNDILRAVLVPAISFILVTLFRNIYCAPRPYEVMGIKPVIDKNTCGKSFPSRHVFSIFVISVTVFYFYPLPGIILGIAGVLMSAVRVIGGVHFIKDVLAGAVIGIACAIVGFYYI